MVFFYRVLPYPGGSGTEGTEACGGSEGLESLKFANCKFHMGLET